MNKVRLLSIAVAGLLLVIGCAGPVGPTTYTVTYAGNGETGGTVPTDNAAYTTGQTVTVLDNTGNLVRTGYSFAGWNTQPDGTGSSYSAAETFAMGTADVTLYASWSSAYSVTYAGNGNTGGTAPVDNTVYATGRTVTVLGNTGDLVRTGYSFAGWNTQPDGTGSSYAAAGTFAMGTADVTLYASWSSAHTVTYAGNGNTGGTAPVDNTRYITGQTVTVLDNTGSLVRTGYPFLGWNTEAGGGGMSYLPAQTFTMGTTDVTLYARWWVSGGAGVTVVLYPTSSILYSRSMTSGRTLLSIGLGPELPLNEWATWRVDSAAYVWLPINVQSGLSYTVSWDDSYQGSSAADGAKTYTGDIEVGAFLSDQVTRVTGWDTDVDSGYITGRSFSVPTPQTVWIRVQPYLGSVVFCGGFGIRIVQSSLLASGTVCSWFLDGATIGGATQSTYVLDPGSLPAGSHRLVAMAERNGATFSEEYTFAR